MKNILINNRRINIFCIVFLFLSVISFLNVRQRFGNVTFLKKSVADISFILKHVFHIIRFPQNRLLAALYIHTVKLVCNCLQTVSADIPFKHLTNYLHLIFINFQITVYLFKAERRSSIFIRSVFHSLLNTPPHILRNRSGLFLCQTAHNRYHHFVGHVVCINIFFLKKYRYAKTFQFTDVFQTISCVRKIG